MGLECLTTRSGSDALTNDDGVGKASEQQAFHSTPACDTGRGCQRNDILFEQIERRIDSALKIRA